MGCSPSDLAIFLTFRLRTLFSQVMDHNSIDLEDFCISLLRPVRSQLQNLGEFRTPRTSIPIRLLAFLNGPIEHTLQGKLDRVIQDSFEGN